MLGTLLKVCGTYFYMCPCCTGIRVWLGDGSDLNVNECMCWQFGSMRSALIARWAPFYTCIPPFQSIC